MVSKVLCRRSVNFYRMEKVAAGFLFCFGFFAFTCTLLLVVFAGLSSRMITVPYRVLFLFGSIAVVLWALINGLSMPRRGCFLLILPFWIILGMRILVEWGGATAVDSLRYRDLFYQSFLQCFVPMVAFWRGYTFPAYRIGLKGLMLFGFISCVFATWLYRGAFVSGIGRLHEGVSVGDVVALNPLNLSYLGSAMIVLGMTLLIDSESFKNKHIGRLASFLAIAAGVPAFLLGASRGSVIAIFACSLLLLFGRVKFQSARKVLVFVGFLGLVGVGLFYFAYITESSVFARFLTLSEQFDGASPNIRVSIWRNAIDLFWSSPIWGAALSLEGGLYPHNHILESFMISGVIGGIPFVAVMLMGLGKAFYIARRSSQLTWIGVVFVHYFVAGLVSNSIMTSAFLWFALAAVFGASSTLERSIAAQSAVRHSFTASYRNVALGRLE